MYAYLSDLSNALRRIVNLQEFNINPSHIINAVKLLPPEYDPMDPKLDDNALYVCEYRQFLNFDIMAELPPLVCVLEAGSNADTVLLQGRRVILVYGCTVVDVLLALSNAVYDSAVKTSHLTELTQQLMACSSVDELMATGFLLLQNPLILTDSTQKIICSTPASQVVSPTYRYILTTEYLPIGHPMPENSEAGDTDYMEPQILSEGDLLEHSLEHCPTVLCTQLVIGGQTLGYLHALAFNHNFTTEDRHLVQLLSNLLAMELFRHPMTRRQQHIESAALFFRSILDNSAGNAEQIMEKQREIRLQLNTFLYVASIKPKSSDFSAHIDFYELSQSIPRLLPNCRAFLYHESILMVLDSKKEILSMEEYLQPILPLLERHKLAIGISKPFSVIHQLRANAYQARKALALGTRLRPESSIYCFSDYLLFYIAETCLKTNEIETLCPAELIRLIIYCQENGNELLDTLQTYLYCGRNKTITAQKMFVHVNTIKYRISQIQSITGLNLSDDETALRLLLAHKMFEYKHALGDTTPGDV